MKSHFTGAALLSAPLIILASCSQNQSSSQDRSETPNVNPSAAPGVAWRYAYDFQLSDGAIATVQEAHASKCEALGITRCRITGLRYSVSDDDAVSAMLEVKLAPEIARAFGKQAAFDVRKAGGRLTNTEFSGEDTAPALSKAATVQAESRTRMGAIERQLGNAALKDNERAQLQVELQQLRSVLAEARSTSADVQQKLASTPMTFNYYGKGGVTGFAGRNPFMDAIRSLVASFVTMINFVLQALALLLPWALLVLLLYAVARSRAARAISHVLGVRSEAKEGQGSDHPDHHSGHA